MTQVGIDERGGRCRRRYHLDSRLLKERSAHESTQGDIAFEVGNPGRQHFRPPWRGS